MENNDFCRCICEEEAIRITDWSGAMRLLGYDASVGFEIWKIHGGNISLKDRIRAALSIIRGNDFMLQRVILEADEANKLARWVLEIIDTHGIPKGV